MKKLLVALLILFASVCYAEERHLITAHWPELKGMVEYRVYISDTMKGEWTLIKETKHSHLAIDIAANVHSLNQGALFITVVGVNCEGEETLPMKPIYINLNTEQWRPTK